jgi:predicted RNA polymerase sigma factor
MARLSHVIALAMIEGPTSGLSALDELATDERFAANDRLDATRAHLLERAGDKTKAIRYYRQAAQRTTSTPERNYLLLHAARLSDALERTPGKAESLQNFRPRPS